MAEVGWRLLPEHWKRGLATEAAARLLGHGFQELKLPEIVAFAVWNNHASTAVMRRLGMSPVEEGAFDDPTAPPDRPDLKRCVLFRITAGDWMKDQSAG